MTQAWAQTLMSVDAAHYGPIPVGYDRLTGASLGTIEQLANGTFGPYVETFHFALNNHVAADNRIPPYGMDCETARVRNALPVPSGQYGGPAEVLPDPGCAGVTYQHWDDVALSPPAGAASADITLYYQGTSWEYVQFLWLANDRQNAFLGDEGVNFLDAWLNAAPAAPMVPPFPMATARWGTPPDTCVPTDEICDDGIDNDCDDLIDADDPDCATGGGNCADYPDKGTCNADPACAWSGSPKSGSCGDRAVCEPTASDEIGLCGDGIDNDCDGLTDCADTADCGADPVCQIDCSVYTTRALCNDQAACRWDNKGQTCIAR
jgi:hypothetical protein